VGFYDVTEEKGKKKQQHTMMREINE
jgi:hypothetical protein